MTFSTPKQKSPSIFGDTMLCMFRCADTILLWKW